MSRHALRTPKRHRRFGFGVVLAVLGSCVALLFGLTAAVAAYAYPPPSSPKQVDKTGTSVTIRWNSVPTANLYYVRYSTDPTFRSDKHVVSSKETTKNITGLKPSTWYYIQVRAAKGTTSNHTLLTEYGPYDAFRTYDYSFNAPSGFRADYGLNNTAGTSSTVGLSWNFVNNADSYRLWISGGGSTWTEPVQHPHSLIRIPYEVTGLKPGTQYRFRVRGLEQTIDPVTNDYYLLTDWSNDVVYDTPAVSDATNVTELPPSQPTLTNIAAKKIGLQWEKAEGSTATGYRINYTYGGENYWYSVPSDAATHVEFTDFIPNDNGPAVMLAKGREFTFRVAALRAGSRADGTRISDYSSRLSVKAGFDMEPPGNLRVDGFTGSSATISWDPVPGATEYRVDWTRSANPSGRCEEDDNSCTRTGSAATSYTIEDLRPGVTYYFRVSAVSGTSTISDYQPIMASATTIADAPQMVKQVPNNPASTTAITVQWSPSVPSAGQTIDGYQVRWSTDMNMKNASSSGVSSALSRRITGLAAEKLHFLQVRGRYSNGTYTGWSAITAVYTRPIRGSISGTVNDLPGTDSSVDTVVYAYSATDHDVGGVARPAADGTFTVWDLPPGSWRLHYAYFGDKEVTSPWYHSSGSLPFYKSQASNIVTSSSNVTVNTVTPVAGISIRGAVTGTFCRAGTRVTALSDNTGVTGAKDTVLGDTHTAANGTYVIHGLPKGEGYWLRLVSTNCGTKSVRVLPTQTGTNVIGVNTDFGATDPDPEPDPDPSGPTVVQNVRTTGTVGTDDATLAWDAFPGAAKYRVYWSTSPTMPSTCEPTCQVYSLAELDGTSPPSISLKKVIGNVRAGDTYYVKVSATDTNTKLISKGGWSGIKAVSLSGPLAPLPDTVQNIRDVSSSSSGVTIGWDAVPTATKYRVYYSSSSSMPSRCEPNCEVIVPADRANPRFRIASSQLNRKYVKVSAITTVNGDDKTITGWQATPHVVGGDSGGGDSGGGDSADTGGSSDLVSGLTIKSGTLDSADATLTWDAFPGAGMYTVYWSTVPSMPSRCEPTCQKYALAELDGTVPPEISLKKVIGNVRAGEKYYVKVSASDATGKLISLGGWQASPLSVDLDGADASLPGTVQNIRRDGSSSGSITIAWDAYPTATKYRIYYKSSTSMPSRCEPYCSVIVPASRTNPTFTIPSSRHYVKVSAIITENGKDRTITGWQPAAVDVS